MERPQSIVWFERCYLAALLLGAINTALQWQTIQERIAANPASAVVGSWFMPATLAISWGITLLLWYFTARRASNVTRWIIAVFFAIGVLSVIGTLVTGQYPPGLAGIVGTVAFGLQAVAVWMLFRPDAKPWFAGQPTNLTDTFS